MIEFAELLDELSADRRIFLTESPAEIVLAHVEADLGRQALEHARRLGWQVRVENAAAEEVIGDLNPAFQPFRFTISKPLIEGRTRLLTLAGFAHWLSEAPSGLVQVARCDTPFETGLFRVSNWTDDQTFEPIQRAKSPRSLVRETQHQRVVPDDIRAWLALDDPEPRWDDPAFRVWAKHATRACFMSIATEVSAGPELSFRGSAQLVLRDPPEDFLPTEAQFWYLQRTVHWVYESPSETETRFRLVNYELGRLGRSSNVTIGDVSEYMGVAFESARLAFQYSLAKVSAETAKSLSDLRKSLSEETFRLSEMIRQVIGAVSGAVFIGIGLIAARFSTDTPKAALLTMGVVLCGYVSLVIYSGDKHIKTHRDMRTVWRNRLYGYISDDDYRRMIIEPAGKVESQFHTAALWGIIITGLIMLAILAAVCL